MKYRALRWTSVPLILFAALATIVLLLSFQPTQAGEELGPSTSLFQSAAAITPTLQFITSFGGEGGDMVVDGNRAYVGNGTQLIIYEWYPTPAQYWYQGILHLPGAIHQLQVQDGILYVADGSGGFRMYSTTAPYPLLYRSTDGLSVQGFLLDGDLVYLSTLETFSTTLKILELSVPNAPIVRGQAGALLGAKLDKVGNYIYSGQAVIDVSNPDSPVQIAQLNEPLVEVASPFAFTSQVSCGMLGCDGDIFVYDITNPASPNKVGNFEVDSYVEDIISRDDLAYFLSNGLDIVNLSDPAHPALISHTQSSAESLRMDGDNLYLIEGGYLDYDGFYILDVSDPGNPVELGAYRMTGGVYDLSIAAPFAYLRSESDDRAYNEFHVIDISDPSNPTQVSQAAEWSINGIRDIKISGERGYLLSTTGCCNPTNPQFQILDIENALSPLPLGGYDTSFALSLQLIGESAYVRNDISLEVFDVSDSSHPNLLTTYFSGGSLAGVRVFDNHLAYLISDHYIYDYWETLDIVDFSQPLSPTLVSTFTVAVGLHPFAFDATDEYALVGLDDNNAIHELRIVDTSSTVSPTLAGVYISTSSIIAIHGAGERVYLTTTDRFEILDITNPLTPTLLGAYPIEGWGNQILLHDGLIYLSLIDKGVLVLDVSDPAAPQPLAFYPCAPASIHIEGGLLYIAGGEGVQVVGLYPPSAFFPMIEVRNSGQ